MVAVERAERFRLHPLGFFYLQDEVNISVKRRIHVWLPDGGEGSQKDKHVHSFDVESVVVVGRMRSQLFEFIESTGGDTAEFLVSYDGTVSILKPTGKRGRLKIVASFETSAGGSYRLAAGMIHRVQADTMPCVTMVKTYERGCPIYTYGIDNNIQSVVRRAVTREEARSIAFALEEALETMD